MRLSLLLLGVATLLQTSVARGEELSLDPPVAAAFVTGAAAQLLPLGIGATLIATSEGRPTRNAGLYVIESGFIVAPLVAHGVVGEWKRGALFALAPAVTALGMATLIQTNPDVITAGKLPPQYFFVGIFIATMVTSTFGVLDALGTTERASLRGLTIAPMAGRSELGLTLGGLL